MTDFLAELNKLPVDRLAGLAEQATDDEVCSALATAGTRCLRLDQFATLLSPAAARREMRERIAQKAHAITIRHFGRVMRFFAPLYLSNECINVCRYCGFSRDNPILRVTLTLEEVLEEARYLRQQGFRHILLVAGEHPYYVSRRYLCDCVRMLRSDWPSISLEVGPMEVAEYREIVRAGAEGLVIYQETYDQAVYAQMHRGGPKTDFAWRLATPERAYAAGFKRLGIGALLGLTDWRRDAIALVAHALYLQRRCWQSLITISVPRLRPAAGQFQPPAPVSDAELVQLVCALRLALPQVGLVLSTREPARLRDCLVPLGVTMMSAGSHTEPGGYTGQGAESLHVTRGGRQLRPQPRLIQSEGEHATEQFEVADTRSPAEVARRVAALGYEPVWKDWEVALNEV